MSRKLKNIAVVYGGRSVEHEISIITALQLMKILDVRLYKVIPVYIAHSGHWYTGDKLFDRNTYKTFEKSRADLTEVYFRPLPDNSGLFVQESNFKDRLKYLFTAQQKTIPVDVFLLAFHGEYGEDGCIQGLFEMADVAYSGCDVMGSSIAMNKYICKSVLRDHGIPTLPAKIVHKFKTIQNLDQTISEITSTSGLNNFPLFVKPNHLGSSIGISKARNRAALEAGLAKVFLHDTEAIIEPSLEDMFEINVSVLDDGKPRASVLEIPSKTGDALSYEDKYLREGGKKKGQRKRTGAEGMASLVRDIDPKGLTQEIKDKVTAYAIKSFEVLNCSGVVRFDFMHDNTSGNIYFNELNPQPGSLSFYLWVKSHPPLLYTEEMNKVILAAERRRQEKASRERELGFKALK